MFSYFSNNEIQGCTFSFLNRDAPTIQNIFQIRTNNNIPKFKIIKNKILYKINDYLETDNNKTGKYQKVNIYNSEFSNKYHLTSNEPDKTKLFFDSEKIKIINELKLLDKVEVIDNVLVIICSNISSEEYAFYLKNIVKLNQLIN